RHVVLIRSGEQPPAIYVGRAIPRHIGSLLPIVTVLYHDVGLRIRGALPLALIRTVTSAATPKLGVVAGIAVADVVEQFALVGKLGIIRLRTPTNDHIAVIQRLGIGHGAGRAFFGWGVFGDHRGGHRLFVDVKSQAP